MTARTRWWIVLLATLVGAAVTARLGVWQLGRAAQKIALQQAQDGRASMPPLAWAELATARTDPAAAEAQHYRRTVLEGRWVQNATVFLENRQMDGRVGFFVITPLRLDGRDDAVLVQRGWTPRDLLDRTHVPHVPTPEGRVVIEGRIAPPPGRLYEFEGAGSGTIRQNLDPVAYGNELHLPLRPWSLLQDAPERVTAEPVEARVAGAGSGGSQGSDDQRSLGTAPMVADTTVAAIVDDGLLRHWSLPALDVQKHYGYAFQWFAMSALMTGLYVWFQLVRPRLRASRSVDVAA